MTHAASSGLSVAESGSAYITPAEMPKDELVKLIKELEKQMKAAAQALEFEKAAALRDQIMELRGIEITRVEQSTQKVPARERLRRTEEKVSYKV